MCVHALRKDPACIILAFLLPTFEKRPQGSSTWRTTATPPATAQTPETAVNRENTMLGAGTPGNLQAATRDATELLQDPEDAPPRSSCSECSGTAPAAAAEHITHASRASTPEVPPGSGTVSHPTHSAISSLDDVVAKLASERDESAVALCGAVRTLQRSVQADMRKLCKPWGVQTK